MQVMTHIYSVWCLFVSYVGHRVSERQHRFEICNQTGNFPHNLPLVKWYVELIRIKYFKVMCSRNLREILREKYGSTFVWIKTFCPCSWGVSLIVYFWNSNLPLFQVNAWFETWLASSLYNCISIFSRIKVTNSQFKPGNSFKPIKNL